MSIYTPQKLLDMKSGKVELSTCGKFSVWKTRVSIENQLIKQREAIVNTINKQLQNEKLRVGLVSQ